jgi:hypothetical protein
MLRTSSHDVTLNEKFKNKDEVVSRLGEKDQEEVPILRTQQSIALPVLSYTESSECINSHTCIKHPTLNKKGKGSPDHPSSIKESEARKAPMANNGGQKKKRHTTIKENADEEMLQSCTDSGFKFQQSRPKEVEAPHDLLGSIDTS